MFNDERERIMLERNPHSQSIQSWAARREQRQPHRSRALLVTGKSLVALGVTLTKRFGVSDPTH